VIARVGPAPRSRDFSRLYARHPSCDCREAVNNHCRVAEPVRPARRVSTLNAVD